MKIFEKQADGSYKIIQTETVSTKAELETMAQENIAQLTSELQQLTNDLNSGVAYFQGEIDTLKERHQPNITAKEAELAEAELELTTIQSLE